MNKIFYFIYACKESDYHYGSPKGKGNTYDYNDREMAIQDARGYCDGNDLVQVRGFVTRNGELEQVETIQIK